MSWSRYVNVSSTTLLKNIWPHFLGPCCNSEMQFTLQKLLFWPIEFLMESRVLSRPRNFQVSSHLSLNRKSLVLGLEAVISLDSLGPCSSSASNPRDQLLSSIRRPQFNSPTSIQCADYSVLNFKDFNTFVGLNPGHNLNSMLGKKITKRMKMLGQSARIAALVLCDNTPESVINYLSMRGFTIDPLTYIMQSGNCPVKDCVFTFSIVTPSGLVKMGLT